MKEEEKRKIAFAVASKAGNRSGGVYSFQSGVHNAMSGSAGSYYDHNSGSHFSDSYDYGSGGHRSISVNGDKFSGYDYQTGHHFSGKISGNQVQIYDYGTGGWSNYSV